MKKDWGVLILLALSAALTLSVSHSGPQKLSSTHIAQALPMALNGWTGRDVKVDERTYQILETRDVLMRDYQKAGESPVLVCLVFGSRSSTHPPEVCYQGDGYEISDKKIVQTALPDLVGGKLSANLFAAQRNGGRQGVLYWYKSGARFTPKFLSQQWASLISGGKRRGALIRLSTPLYPDEARAVERMESLAESLLPYLETQ